MPPTEERATVEMTGFGMTGKLSGPIDMIMFIVFLALFAVVIYTQFRIINMIDVRMSELLYVISLPEQDRKELKLAMPPSLRNGR